MTRTRGVLGLDTVLSSDTSSLPGLVCPRARHHVPFSDGSPRLDGKADCCRIFPLFLRFMCSLQTLRTSVLEKIAGQDNGSHGEAAVPNRVSRTGFPSVK